MSGHRKLGRPTDQRLALLRGQVTDLLDKGYVKTTLCRAKEVRKIAEKIITLAARECEGSVKVTKNVLNEKGQSVQKEVVNDSPAKLAARRAIMAQIYDVKPVKAKNENRKEYSERLGGVRHPLVEKLFTEVGPKYKKRAAESGQGGGYTRIIRLGARKGDGAEMVILELV